MNKGKMGQGEGQIVKQAASGTYTNNAIKILEEYQRDMETLKKRKAMDVARDKVQNVTKVATIGFVGKKYLLISLKPLKEHMEVL